MKNSNNNLKSVTSRHTKTEIWSIYKLKPKFIHHRSKGTWLILGDSVLVGMHERILTLKKYLAEIGSFPTINDFFNYLNPIL